MKTILSHRCFLDLSFCLTVLNYLPNSCDISQQPGPWESGVAMGAGRGQAELMAFFPSKREMPLTHRAGRMAREDRLQDCKLGLGHYLPLQAACSEATPETTPHPLPGSHVPKRNSTEARE